MMLQDGEHNDHIKFKKEIGLKYLELMNQLLKETFRALQFKGLLQEQKFAEKLCAYAYFRLPLFRETVLTALTEHKDPELPEWRGTEHSLYE